MAAANGVRGRAPGLVSAFRTAPTKRFSPSLPAWRAPVGRAALLRVNVRKRMLHKTQIRASDLKKSLNLRLKPY